MEGAVELVSLLLELRTSKDELFALQAQTKRKSPWRRLMRSDLTLFSTMVMAVVLSHIILWKLTHGSKRDARHV